MLDILLSLLRSDAASNGTRKPAFRTMAVPSASASVVFLACLTIKMEGTTTLLLCLSMYSYWCLCILIVRPCILIVVYVFLRWVHTCNVTAYRNAVTLQETDTIRSYELNFHFVPHGVTVSWQRYKLAFPVCHGSSGWWWRVTLPVHTCSGRNRTIPLMWRPNTDSTPNKPVT